MKEECVRDAACVNHVAFEYPTLDELLETWDRLKGLGILPHETVDHGPTFSLYYFDPDGNNVELFTDAFGDWERSKKFFLENEEFHRNPMGKEIDPAQLIEVSRKGMSLEEVHERALRGEFGREAQAGWDAWAPTWEQVTEDQNES
jgi:catechol-2,3-dioxygenase